MKIKREPNRITIITNVPADASLGRISVKEVITDELTGEKRYGTQYAFQYTDAGSSSVGTGYCSAPEEVEGCIAFSYSVPKNVDTKKYIEGMRETIELIMKFEDQAATEVVRRQTEKAVAQAKFDALFVD